jgi:hypothetical protein
MCVAVAPTAPAEGAAEVQTEGRPAESEELSRKDDEEERLRNDELARKKVLEEAAEWERVEEERRGKEEE